MESANPLEPPTVPFAPRSRSESMQSLSPKPDQHLLNRSSSPSLSVNYVPSKFSPLTNVRRRNKGGGAALPKNGGGREAFKAGEARMPAAGDEDYDGVQGGWFGGKEGGRTKQRLRWTKFKWILFVANTCVRIPARCPSSSTPPLTSAQLSIYSITALIFCLLTWFNVWTHADVVRVGNRPELILSTLAASAGIVTSLIGWSGILLNNRGFLAVYTFLLWICFALLVVPGYITYKRRTFNLQGKINAEWSRDLGTDGRLRIQNQLACCGYFSPFVEAAISATCYSRSVLPGCKGPYVRFERMVLERWYIVAFSLVPLHIAVIVSGLLCSNHVTYRFGKGMMPKAYRLSMNSMAVIMDNYAKYVVRGLHRA
jgi:hypothetical protein